MRLLFVFLAAAFHGLSPRLHACSVCFAADERGRFAYYFVTAFLSLLPLLMLTLAAYGLARLLHPTSNNPNPTKGQP